MYLAKGKLPSDPRINLMHTAARLFADLGFEAVSTRMLAREAGVNIAMIVYYFGSKEKLFEAIIDEHIPKTGEMLRNSLQAEMPPWEKVCISIDTYVDRMFGNAPFAKLMYRELSLHQRPEFSKRILDAISRNWEVMAEIIQEGQDQNIFKRDVDVVMVMASLFGTILQIVNTPCVARRMLHIESDDGVFSESVKQRLKNHLKQMLSAHLFTHK